MLDAALAALAVGSRLVIAVDQFEEVFTQAADDEREEFIDLLTRAANDPEHRVLVLIAQFGRTSTDVAQLTPGWRS